MQPSWHQDPIYTNFWKHYDLSTSWLRSNGFNPVEVVFDNEKTSSVEVKEEKRESGNEISEEYLSFIMETRRHQREREKLRRKKEKMQANEFYVDVAEVKPFTRLSEVPNANLEEEQASVKRRKELIELYGPEGAVTIGNMEAILQLNFNKFCDEHTPKLWPIACRL